MKSNYRKRTQKDYSLSLKLQITQEIEQGLLTATKALNKYGIQAGSTVRTWLKKYGNFNYQFTIHKSMSKTPERHILELEQQVRLLEKQKNRAEHLASRADEKAIMFDIAEKELKIPIRKKHESKLFSLITDAYSKKNVGYNVRDNLSVKGSLAALEMALKNRNHKKDL